MALINICYSCCTCFLLTRINVTKLSALRALVLVALLFMGWYISLGTSAAPLLLLLSVAAPANPIYGFILALAFGIGRGLPFLL